jgi:cyclopropane-fatty-acyl-phospholipid synthase
MFPLSKMLERLVQIGRLTVIDARGTEHVFGGTPGTEAVMELTDPQLYWKLVVNTELHAGEAYMDGRMRFPGSSLRAFMELIAENRAVVRPQPSQKAFATWDRRLKRLQQANPIGRAQRNVAHHYDLGNDFYRLFLDEGMFYSCAYFPHGNETLEAAQVAKCRHIAAKLDLKPGQRVLDIGCGWGGLALYLARFTGVEVLGVTLSTEQHALAVARAEAEGLADRVRFELRDYREVKGPFDRIVSVGMFEHVGAAHYHEFFGKVHELLDRDGIMLLHSIGKMSPPSVASPWLRKYIFPGGYAPALSEVFPATEANKLWVTDLEFLRLHYAITLRHWHERFEAKRAQVAAMYDERFCRMWEFYLLGVEMMFRTGAQQVFQMQLAHRRDAVPLTRDYIGESESRLSALETRSRTENVMVSMS